MFSRSKILDCVVRDTNPSKLRPYLESIMLRLQETEIYKPYSQDKELYEKIRRTDAVLYADEVRNYLKELVLSMKYVDLYLIVYIFQDSGLHVDVCDFDIEQSVDSIKNKLLTLNIYDTQIIDNMMVGYKNGDYRGAITHVGSLLEHILKVRLVELDSNLKQDINKESLGALLSGRNSNKYRLYLDKIVDKSIRKDIMDVVTTRNKKGAHMGLDYQSLTYEQMKVYLKLLIKIVESIDLESNVNV